MIPYYTHVFGRVATGEHGADVAKATMGILTNTDTTISMLGFLVIFGTDAALAYFYLEEKDPQKKLRYVQNIMGFRVTVSVSLLVISSLVAWLFPESVYLVGSINSAIQISVWTMLFETIGVLAITVYRLDMRTIRVVVLSLLKLLLIAILSYLFLTYVSPTLQSIFYARLISIVFILLITGKQVLSYLKIRFDREIWKEVLAYSAPLVPATLAFWIIGSSNRYFIVWLMGGGAFSGIYGLAVNYASMITLVTYGMQMAWRTYSMQIKNKEGSEHLFAKIYMGIFVIGMLMVMVITNVMPWVIRINHKAFWEAYQYVGFLSLGSFLNFYYLIVSAGLFFTKQTKPISHAFGIAAVVSLGLNASLIPLWGLWGCVAANVATYLLALILIIRSSQKSYYIPVSTTKLGLIFLQTVISMAAMVFIQVNSYPVYWLILPWLYFIATLIVCRVDKELNFKSLQMESN